MAQFGAGRRVRRSTGVLGVVGLLVLAICSPASGLTAAPATKGRSAVYIVELAEQPVAAYKGGRSGLPATKPARGQKLDSTSANVRRYAAHLDARQTAVLQSAGAASTAKLYGYQYSFNGFAASLTPAQAAKLQRDPAVRKVSQDRLDHTMTDNTPDFLGLDAPGGLWSQAGGQGRAGEDVVVGIIDTGIWPEHPSFSDQSDLADRPGATGRRTAAYGPAPSYFHGTCQAGELWSKDDCNNKLIGARYFLKGFGHFGIIKDDFESPRDADGHGSHTASTAAGNAGVDPSIFGRDLGVGTISGMAPRARIAAYKACWEDGCALSDLVAAIDSAVADGVDVINYSIGSDTPELLGPDEVSFLFAAAANVFVAASAGNAGPGTGTVGSPASAPWVTAVGANTHDRFLAGTVRLGNGATYRGASVTRGLPRTALVDGKAAGSIGCEAGKLDPAVVSGKVVLCEGSRLRAARGQAVLAAGGVGMILYNVGPSMMTFSDNHYLPAVHIDNVDGLAIRSYITAQGAAATAAIEEGGAVGDPTAPAMTHFSSRGPNGASGDVIKPDVTAPGMQILAAGTPVALHSAPGQLYQAISGTSMSSPHVAGVGALLVQAHRDWTPGMIRSALMTTASQDVTKEDRITPADPFDFGGGHIQPNPATNPGLTYDADFLNYIAYLCGVGELAAAVCTTPTPAGFGVQPIDPSDLNLPSIGIEALAGTQTVTRQVRSTGAAGTYTASVAAPAGVNVSVTPPQLTLAAGQEGTFQVHFTSTNAAVIDQWAFGSLTWSGHGLSVRSPIAVRPVALSAPDEVTGTGTSGEKSFEVTFGASGPFTAAPHGLVPATREAATVVDDPASDINVALQTGVGLREHVIAVAAGTRHLRASLFDADTDGDDDLDLYLFDPAGNFVSESGSATSNEQVDAANPVPGNWKVLVHAWQTDGADAAYTLSSWRVSNAAAGNLSVSAPAVATIGQQGTVSIAWSGLTAAIRYLGAVSYGNGTAETDQTLVAVAA